ncbi:large ribosomal subunit protein mL43 [Manis javanica]|uniref:large ribosomal subunit protein mL43 n=1 Tax=Manis javanica TaxID=9974 RepID=UPI001879669C|nr:39S ribosomal protein L43, mitochondrial [Manis javanica]KAI5932576.1 39S ribosomal protein L43, mitochondrial [Manis javanica]
MTARGTPSRFLTSVLHNGMGRYVQQLQRLSFSLSRDGPSSRGAREFVEREVTDFARRNPGVVIYVNARPCSVPRVVAEYLNGALREESIHCKSVEEIATLVQKLADQSGLDVIRIRKPFHTDNPSIQGQWHPFTNKPTTLGALRPREIQDPAPAQGKRSEEMLYQLRS